MTDTRKKDFITRLATKNLKRKLDLIKEKSTRERIIELYKIVQVLNNDQINAIKTDLKKFTPELTAADCQPCSQKPGSYTRTKYG